MPSPKVTVFLGSDSDIPKFEKALTLANTFRMKCSLVIASAHRSPAFLASQLRSAEKNGAEVIIAGAGSAAHLAGVIASHTTLPVIGVPIDSSPLKGLDSLLSSVMMPSGIPVAVMALGESGAKNAVIFAAQILSLKYPALKKLLAKYRRGLANSIKIINTKLKNSGK